MKKNINLMYFNHEFYFMSFYFFVSGDSYIDKFNENLWVVIKGNLTKLEDIQYYYQCFYLEKYVAPNVSDLFVLMCMKNIFEEIIFDQWILFSESEDIWKENIWKIWLEKINEAYNIKGKALFRPLRQFIFKSEHGPCLSSWFFAWGPKRTQSFFCGL